MIAISDAPLEVRLDIPQLFSMILTTGDSLPRHACFIFLSKLLQPRPPDVVELLVEIAS